MRKFYNEKLETLKNNNILNAELDLKLMINNSTNRNNYSLINELEIKDLDIIKFNNFFKRRIKGEPISKIFNNKEFWSLNFYTNQDVLDPRPETELIIEGLMKYRKEYKNFFSICDFGTGSGCVIISILNEYKLATGVGIDISKEAIAVAKKNSSNHNLNKRLNLINDDWKNINEKFDIIVSNPPYISINDYAKLEKEVINFDPKISLIGGEDGFEKIYEIAPIVYRCMKNTSIFLLEIGYSQRLKTEKIFFQNDMKLIDILYDLQGIERVLIFQKKSN